MVDEFNIDIVRRDRALYVEIEGELDVSTAPIFDAKMTEAVAADAPLVVIDLAGVSFVDSMGLRSLIQAHARAPDADRLRITGAGGQVQRLFELTQVRLPLLSRTEP